MKHLILVLLLLLPLVLADDYVVPDYEYDDTDPDCDNISILLVNAMSDLTDMKHYVGTTLPSRLAKLKQALNSIAKTCNVIQSKRPSLVQVSSKVAKQRKEHLFFLIKTSDELKEVMKAPHNSKIDESKDHIMMLLEMNLLASEASDPEDICNDNQDALNDLIDYIEWLIPALQKSYVQGSLEDRVNELNAYRNNCGCKDSGDSGEEEDVVIIGGEENNEEEQQEEEQQKEEQQQEEQKEEKSDDKDDDNNGGGGSTGGDSDDPPIPSDDPGCKNPPPDWKGWKFYLVVAWRYDINQDRNLNLDLDTNTVNWVGSNGLGLDNQTTDRWTPQRSYGCGFIIDSSTKNPGHYLHASSKDKIDVVSNYNTLSAVWTCVQYQNEGCILENANPKYKGLYLTSDANGNVYLDDKISDDAGWIFQTRY